MNRLVTALAVVAALAAAPAFAADVGVSVAISEPGVYGRIDIGRFPQPVLVAPQPVVIAPQPAYAHRQPVYVWVPPGHRKNWRKHCRKYDACAVPVYFVRDDWYRQHAMHEGRGRRADRHDDRHEHGRGGRHGDRHDHRDDQGDRHDHGHGKGHGKGHDKH